MIESLSYAYDVAGNRISLTRTNGTASNLPTAVQAAYDAANEQIQFNAASPNQTFDANGNQTTSTDASGTTTYTWDARNRLIARSGPGINESYSYDVLGRRISKTINGETKQFLYDGNDIVQDIGGGAVGASYVRSLSIDEPFVRQTTAGDEFYHVDALGSTLDLTNQVGAVQASYHYEAFGKTTVTGVSSNPFQYTGRENDGTGLYYYRARYYSTSLQRFVSEDPSQFYGGVNFYAYGALNPVMNIDPFGLVTWPGRGTPTSPGQEFGAGRPGGGHHNGLDIPNDLNGGVKASHSGTIESTDSVPCHGQGCSGPTNQVIVRNDDGSRSGYAHVDPSSVRPGQHLNEGDPVGTTDRSGRSTAPHVHYTYTPPGGNAPVDPRNVLPKVNNYNNPGGTGGGAAGSSGSGGRK